MLRETCPKFHTLAEADPGKTHKILTPLIQLLPEPELSIQILHEDKRKKKKDGGRKRGRPSLTYTFLHRGPFRLFFGNRPVFPEHKYNLVKALFQPQRPKSSEIRRRALAILTCSQGQPRPCSEWWSTSWEGCFSGLYGRRRTAMTEDLRTRRLTEGILAEVFPTRSRILGSLSSRRVWLPAYTSLQAKRQQ